VFSATTSTASTTSILAATPKGKLDFLFYYNVLAFSVLIISFSGGVFVLTVIVLLSVDFYYVIGEQGAYARNADQGKFVRIR
jgi:hypothetical protein